MKDFRGTELCIGDTVAIVTTIGDFSARLKLGTVIGFSSQFGKDTCIVKYSAGEGYAPNSTFKHQLLSSCIVKLE